jgi:NDP-sugar pyrophosphorylase family protein
VFKPTDLFDLSHCGHKSLYDNVESAWEVLQKIKPYLEDFFANNESVDHSTKLGDSYIGNQVFIGEGTEIEPGVFIKGPAIIGKNCKIRACAYIRENFICGDGCTIGNSCEFKNVLLHDEAEIPHFAYVGDSLLGWKAHLGAGVKVSNLRIDRKNILVKSGEQIIETGLRKFGCLLGDQAEVGCNSVLNPGTIIGPRTLAVTNLALSGYYPADSFIKLKQQQQVVARR